MGHSMVIGILSYYEFWKNLPRFQNALCAKINIESFQEFRILNQKSFLLGFCWEFKNQFSPNCSDGSPEAWGTQGSSWNVWILGLTEFNLNSSLDFRNLFRIPVLERFSENCKILENILVIHSRKEWLLPCCDGDPALSLALIVQSFASERQYPTAYSLSIWPVLFAHSTSPSLRK